MARHEELMVGNLRVEKITPLATGTQPATIADITANLNEAYATPGLDTEAEVIAAFNTTNAKVNALITAFNTVLARLEAIGINASS